MNKSEKKQTESARDAVGAIATSTELVTVSEFNPTTLKQPAAVVHTKHAVSN